MGIHQYKVIRWLAASAFDIIRHLEHSVVLVQRGGGGEFEGSGAQCGTPPAAPRALAFRLCQASGWSPRVVRCASVLPKRMISAIGSGRQSSLQQLQRRFDRLRQLQQRICQPCANSFEAYGTKYFLPLPPQNARGFKDTPHRSLEYLAGFFDGDGCALSTLPRNTVRLEVEQSDLNAKVLLFLRNILGGGLYRKSFARTGLQRSVVRWQATGTGAEHAATILGAVPSCKQAQLKIVGSWPRDKAERQQASRKLKQLKQTPPSTAACPSWAFLAGFFDADGCIQVVPSGFLRLCVTQKFDSVLLAIKEFLTACGFHSGLYVGKSCSVLAVSKTEDCKSILLRLLSAGLRVKREAARTALRLSAGNGHEIRQELHGLVGHGGRYQRLTMSGVGRAQEINRLRSRLSSAAGRDRCDIALQLEHLLYAHKLESARERSVQIRADVRALLQHAEVGRKFRKSAAVDTLCACI